MYYYVFEMMIGSLRQVSGTLDSSLLSEDHSVLC